MCCPLACGKEFQNNYELTRHLNRKTPCKAGDVECPECRKTFTTKRYLSAHVKDGRCKGKSDATLAEERADEVARLTDQLEQQSILMNMTNQVTSAAANGITIDNSTHNVKNIQNVTINMSSLTAVNPVGQERLSHLTASELCRRLKFVRNPTVFADWCALIRADEDFPENHNVLLINKDDKNMVLCRPDIGWTVGDKDAIMNQLEDPRAKNIYVWKRGLQRCSRFSLNTKQSTMQLYSTCDETWQNLRQETPHNVTAITHTSYTGLMCPKSS